jgi:excisionase family DNA binding protein
MEMPQKTENLKTEANDVVQIRPLYVTEEEAARLLSVSRKTLYRAAKSRRIPRYYFGNTGIFRYRLSEIETLMEAR